ncbi:MAG: hypothetical protein SNG02_00870 [Rikenellaceae bacterium]
MKTKPKTSFAKIITIILFAIFASSPLAIASTSQQRQYFELSDDEITTSTPIYGGDDISYSSDDNLDKDDLRTEDLVLYSNDSGSFNLFVDMSDASNIKEFETVITSGIYVVQDKEKGKSKGKKKKSKGAKDENLDDDIIIKIKYNNGRVTVDAPTVTNIVVYTVDITILNINDRETKPQRPFTVTVYPTTYKVTNASVAEVMLPSSVQEIETIADFSPILSQGFTYDFTKAKISATFESADPNATMSNEVATSHISGFKYESPSSIKYQMAGNDQSPIQVGTYTITVEGAAKPTLGGLNPTTVTLVQTVTVKSL